MSSVGGVAQAILICLLDVALTFVLVKVFLSLTHLSSRLVQTVTAMFGTGVIINLITLPVAWLMDSSPKDSEFQLIGAVLYFMLLIWSLLIMGHILRHSFNLKLSGGILIALGYFLLINTLVQILFPAV